MVSVSCSEDEYTDPNEQPVMEISFKNLYSPHTLLAMGILFTWVIYQMYFKPISSIPSENYCNGFVTAAVSFIIISCLICPSGPFIRPHPLVWRIILGVGIVYTLILCFAIFQTYDTIRDMLIHIDANIRFNKQDTKIYAADCRLKWDIISDKLDIFVPLHLLGWMLKAFMLRHAGLLWLLSAMWEITERCFEHILPNFGECWWDYFILDFLFCNGVGIHLGLYCCRKLEMTPFHWETFKSIKGTKKKLRRIVLQFTPASVSKTNWFKADSTTLRVFQLSLLSVIWQMSELNCFLMKHIFNINTKHYLNFVRIMLHVLLGTPAIRQFYEYITNSRVQKLGTHLWFYCVINTLETLLCIQHAGPLSSLFKPIYLLYWLAAHIACSFVILFIGVKWYEWDANKSSEASKSKKKLN